MKTIAILSLVFLTACSGFNCSIGVGYRKLPEKAISPVFKSVQSMERLGISPDMIKIIMDFLMSENLKVLFPSDSRVDVGAWVEIKGE